MTKRYYRASCYSFKAGCKLHAIMFIDGNVVTMLPTTYTNQHICEEVVDNLNTEDRLNTEDTEWRLQRNRT